MRSALTIAAVCLFSLAAHADTVYTYTGPNFTYVQGLYTTSDSISGTLTLASPLAPNLDGADVDYETFSFSDGVYSDTPANTQTNEDYFFFTTDANGNITAFDVVVIGNDNFFNVSTYPNNIAYAAESILPGTYGYGNNESSEGSFNSGVSTTPEPSSLALLGTGVLGAVGVLRKRFVA